MYIFTFCDINLQHQLYYSFDAWLIFTEGRVIGIKQIKLLCELWISMLMTPTFLYFPLPSRCGLQTTCVFQTMTPDRLCNFVVTSPASNSTHIWSDWTVKSSDWIPFNDKTCKHWDGERTDRKETGTVQKKGQVWQTTVSSVIEIEAMVETS